MLNIFININKVILCLWYLKMLYALICCQAWLLFNFLTGYHVQLPSYNIPINLFHQLCGTVDKFSASSRRNRKKNSDIWSFTHILSSQNNFSATQCIIITCNTYFQLHGYYLAAFWFHFFFLSCSCELLRIYYLKIYQGLSFINF